MTEPTSFSDNLEDTTFERLDGQTIIFNRRTGNYFRLSGPAADVFFLCCSRAPIDTWWDILIMSYTSQPLEEDVKSLIASLLEAGLIVPSEALHNAPNPHLPDDFVRGNWSKPHLEQFDHLRDLILVDPIQDTKNLGWPEVREPHH